MCGFKYLLISILNTAFWRYFNAGCEWIPWQFVRCKSERLSGEGNVNYHMLMPTFSSKNWVKLWKAWSLAETHSCIKMRYMSTTNLKWQFYSIRRYWFNVTALHRANTKVPGLQKLQNTSPLQNSNIFSWQLFTFSNFMSDTSSANPSVVKTKDEFWTPFFFLASAGSTLWSLNYVLTFRHRASSM